jgi:1,4-alpha-glucan branching enzyme
MEKKINLNTCGCRSKKISFQLHAPTAAVVILTGDFNAWRETGVKMKKENAGIWKADLALNPGRYEYKFIVDGKWWTDPKNEKTAINSFGDINSVIEVTC